MINLDLPAELMPKVEDAIASSDKKAIQELYNQLDEHYKSMEKSGASDPFGLEWFYSMVPNELWPDQN